MSAVPDPYKTEGYTRGENAGPFFVPSQADVNTGRAEGLRTQLAKETDPEKRKRLMQQIAIEDKYALAEQAARQVVQDATVRGGFTPTMQADPIAKMQREQMIQKAEQERAFALGKAPTMRWNFF